MKKKIIIPILILFVLLIGGLSYKIYLDYNTTIEKNNELTKLENLVKEKEEAIKELDNDINELKDGFDDRVLLRDGAEGIYESDSLTLVLTRSNEFYLISNRGRCHTIGTYSLINNNKNIRLSATNMIGPDCTDTTEIDRATINIEEDGNLVFNLPNVARDNTLKRTAGFIR